MSDVVMHMIGNAHIDPVWLWEWPEGAGEALSTFRLAADFCEKDRAFIFCHNEALPFRLQETTAPSPDPIPQRFRVIRAQGHNRETTSRNPRLQYWLTGSRQCREAPRANQRPL